MLYCFPKGKLCKNYLFVLLIIPICKVNFVETKNKFKFAK